MWLLLIKAKVNERLAELAIPSMAYIPNNWKQGLEQIDTLMFIYYSIISQIAEGRNLNACQWPNKVRHGQTVE